MATIIDGKKVAAGIKEDLKQKTQDMIKKRKTRPGLALLLVGDNPASQVYVSMKAKACKALDYHSVTQVLPEDATENEVLRIIRNWNNDPTIHGILVQMPLPKHINQDKIIISISPDKDVDGFHPYNFGKLVLGLKGFVPCTPMGIMHLLDYYKVETKGKHVVVVGRSNIVGKPIANMLYQKNDKANAVVTICHTAAKDLTIYTKQADILIAAAGAPEFIKAEHLKKGVVVIDVGTNKVVDPSTEKGYRLTGDVDFEEVKKIASAITPSPGGVGPMTIAMLLYNTYLSALYFSMRHEETNFS